jgi:hypothetical protein
MDTFRQIVVSKIKELDVVSQGLADLENTLRSIMVLIAVTIMINAATLGLYLANIRNLTFLLVIRSVLGIAGLVLARKVFKQVRKLKETYKAP